MIQVYQNADGRLTFVFGRSLIPTFNAGDKVKVVRVGDNVEFRVVKDQARRTHGCYSPHALKGGKLSLTATPTKLGFSLQAGSYPEGRSTNGNACLTAPHNNFLEPATRGKVAKLNGHLTQKDRDNLSRFVNVINDAVEKGYVRAELTNNGKVALLVETRIGG